MKNRGWLWLAAVAVLLFPAFAGAETIVREIYFDLDRAAIRDDAKPVLREVADILRANQHLGMALEGHTCDLADNAYNQRLARRRADAATEYLVTIEGIDRSRVLDESYGEERPGYPNDTEENRRKNRRVLITLTVPRTAPLPAMVTKTATLSVLDADGNFLPNLQQQRGVFTVKENGETREIVDISQTMTSTRGTIGLLLDNSHSNCLVDLREAARQFIARRQPQEKLVLMSVSDDLALLSALQHDQQGQLTLVRALERDGYTQLYDGIYEAASSHLAGVTAPRYLVVMSDGVDEGRFWEERAGSVHTLDQAVAAARSYGVKISTVELGPTWPEGSAALQRIAQQTGGRYLVWDNDRDGSQFADLLQSFGGGLRGTYTITYRTYPHLNVEAEVTSTQGIVRR